MVHVERLLWTGCLISCSYYYYSILLLLHSFPIMPVDPFMGCFAGQMKEGQDRASWIVMFRAFCPIGVTHKLNWFWENSSQKIIWKKMHLGFPSAVWIHVEKICETGKHEWKPLKVLQRTLQRKSSRAASVAILTSAKYHRDYFQLIRLPSILERNFTTC